MAMKNDAGTGIDTAAWVLRRRVRLPRFIGLSVARGTVADPDQRPGWTWWQAGLVVGLFVAGVVVRWTFRDFQSGDFRHPLTRWAVYIEQHGGFGAFQHRFSDYNMPYLYLFALAIALPLSHLYAIKLLSVMFDVLMTLFVYRIVALRYRGTWPPALAAAVVFCLPTVVMNSSRWGQADAVFTSFMVGGVYFALGRRSWLTCTMLAVALAIKLQAVFVFPVLGLLMLRRWLRWQALIAVPVVCLLLDIPAFVAGASAHDLLTVYVAQTDKYHYLTLDAPNIYEFFGDIGDPGWLRTAGVVVTGVIVLAFMAWAAIRRLVITIERILLMFTACAVLVPYLLPSMHERYFFPADVLSVVVAFYLPRCAWPVPILMQVGSTLSYLGQMFPRVAVIGPGSRAPSDPPQWALVAGAVSVTITLIWLLWALRRTSPAVNGLALRRAVVVGVGGVGFGV
jgi:Gpi18-like mannosyltransferase